MSDRSGEPAAESPEPRRVGGRVQRVVILTTGMHPCACYLARRLRDSGAEISLVSQTRLKVEHDTWPYFRRLLSRRGPWVTLDYFLLVQSKRFARAAASAARAVLRRSGEPGASQGAIPALRPDPGIADEDWIDVVEVERINSKAERRRLAALEPDLILLAGAPIVSKHTIALARVACINPHYAICPDYAGVSAEWAIFDRRFDDVGYTIHLVNPRVDAGPIICQERVKWDTGRSIRHIAPIVVQAMYDRFAGIAVDLIRGRQFDAVPQRQLERILPPVGLTVRLRAEWRRWLFHRQLQRGSRTGV